MCSSDLSRISKGRVPRASPGSTVRRPAPAAKGPWESSGTQVLCAEAAATESAASAVWAGQPWIGSVPSATPTGELWGETSQELNMAV